jgi:hypothetical protein
LTSDSLANSGAVVQVLQGDRLVRQFEVPRVPGTLWTVFELDGTTITPINSMTFVTGSVDVTSVAGGRQVNETDAGIIRAITTPKTGPRPTGRKSE